MALVFEIPEDFPKSAFEFESRFGTEQACAEFLAKLRWPNGFLCPRCASAAHWSLSRRGLIECADCGHQTSLTAGTVFHGSRKPLRLWFRAMFLMASQKLGLSAKNFQRQMGLPSYQTAWTWLHKLRRAMVRFDRPKLEGTVEVDDAYVGGVEEGSHGRGSSNPIVAVAVEVIADADERKRKRARLGRVRLEVVEDVTQVSLTTFIAQNVSGDANVRTDGLSSYDELGEVGYAHEKRVIGKDPRRASTKLPGVHRIISLVKRWLLGTHQGAVSEKHLPWYLQEYTFRFNRRLSSHCGKLFHRLAEQLMHTTPTTYRALVDGPAISQCAT
jgi:transposase-like protein